MTGVALVVGAQINAVIARGGAERTEAPGAQPPRALQGIGAGTAETGLTR